MRAKKDRGEESVIKVYNLSGNTRFLVVNVNNRQTIQYRRGKSILRPLRNVTNRHDSLLNLILARRPLIATTRQDSKLIRPLKYNIRLKITNDTLKPIRSISKMIHGVLQIRLGTTNISRSLTKLRHLRRLRVVKFSGLFPLLLNRMNKAKRTNNAMRRAMRAYVLSRILEVVNRHVNSILRDLISRLQLLIRRNRRRIIATYNTMATGKISNTRLLRSTNKTRRNLRRKSILIRADLRLLGSLSLLYGRALVTQRRHSLFRVHRATGKILCRLKRGALMIIMIRLATPYLLVVKDAQLRLSVIPIMNILPLRRHFCGRIHATILLLNRVAPHQCQQAIYRFVIRGYFGSFFFHPRDGALHSFFNFSN